MKSLILRTLFCMVLVVPALAAAYPHPNPPPVSEAEKKPAAGAPEKADKAKQSEGGSRTNWAVLAGLIAAAVAVAVWKGKP